MLARVTNTDAWWGWLLMVIALLLATSSEGAVRSAPVTTAKTVQLKPDGLRGRALYEAKCSVCHSVDENRIGPLHKGVLGRKAGTVKEYEYSDALQSSRVVWNQASLEKWLTDPEALIPGQKMGYRLSRQQDRADIVQYLSTLK